MNNNTIVYNIMASSECNADCKYCSWKTVQKQQKEIYDFKKLDYNKKGFKYCFASGNSETFLNIKYWKDVIELIKSDTNKFCEKMTLYTNGLIDNEEVEKFIEENIKYLDLQVSLDGPKEENDKYRVDKNGIGMFDRTYAFIKKYSKYISGISGVICEDHDIIKCMNFLLNVCNNYNISFFRMVPSFGKYNIDKDKLLQFYYCADVLQMFIDRNNLNLKFSKMVDSINLFEISQGKINTVEYDKSFYLDSTT